MSLFVITPEGEAIGWSAWPWDALYTPVVGVFVSGRLVATAPCDLEKPADSRPPSGRLPARIVRRLAQEVLARPLPGRPVELDGPDGQVWFRLPLPAEALDRLQRGDPTARLERLEDGEAVRRAGADRPEPTPGGTLSVEALLDLPDGPSPEPLDGFAAFLTNPTLHQLQGVFHEYLRRLPEQGARDVYMPLLQEGSLSILDLRNRILVSEEFKGRRVGYGARLGATITSRAWRPLSQLPTLGPPRQTVRRIAVADYAALPDAEYVSALSSLMLGDRVDSRRTAASLRICATQGRQALAVGMSRQAACRGVFLEVV